MAGSNFAIHNLPPNLVGQLPHPQTPWVFSSSLRERIEGTERIGEGTLSYRRCLVLPVDPEWDFIWQYFHFQKPTTYGIKRIYCVLNEWVLRRFVSELAASEERAGDLVYQPRWRQNAPHPHRERVMERWDQLANPAGEGKRAYVLPVWHGTSEATVRSISQYGFDLLGRGGDGGFFGPGIYFTTSAKYAVNAYSSDGSVLLSFAWMRRPFPVVYGDRQRGMLNGQPHDNQNANYIPVVSAKPDDPFHPFYEATGSEQVPMCDEIVVRHPSQTFAPFCIELQPDLPFSPESILPTVEMLFYFVVNVLRHKKGTLNEKVNGLLKKLAVAVRGPKCPSEENCASVLIQCERMGRFFSRELTQNLSSPYIEYCRSVLVNWRNTFNAQEYLTLFPMILAKLLPDYNEELKNGWDYGCEVLLAFLEPPEQIPFSPFDLLKQFLKKRRSVSLLEFAVQKIVESEGQEENFPLLDGIVAHLRQKGNKMDEHEELYGLLSSKAALEPMRRRYLDKIGTGALFNKLASIPNRDGYRQKMRLEQEALRRQIEAITQTKRTRVKVRTPFFSNRYLRSDLIEMVDLQSGDIRKQYSDSSHSVYRIHRDGFDLHLKQQPREPMKEYAVYSLTSRIAGKGVPPSDLMRFDVTLSDGSTKSYPVLVSETVKGDNLKDYLARPGIEFDRGHLTHMLLMGLLTRPGDGRAANFIVTPKKEICCVDNDASFVEPIVNGLLYNTVNFNSILYCLDNEPLDPKILEEWKNLSPDLILNGWIEELLQKEEKYISLFTHEEREYLYNKNPNLSFTPSLVLSGGMITTIYTQLSHLQHVLKEHIPTDGMDLLNHLISLRASEIGINNIGPRLNKFYKKAYRDHLTPVDRLKAAIGKKLDQSVTSAGAYKAGVGKIPTLEEIRGTYSLRQLQEEFRAYTLFQEGNAFVTMADGRLAIQCNFSNITQGGKPDLERQRVMIRGLQEWLSIDGKKPEVVTLRGCAALRSKDLLPFCTEGLACLDLQGSAIEALPPEIQQCRLKMIDLRGCQELKGFMITGFLTNVPFDLPYLEKLFLAGCSELAEVHLKAPLLEELSAHDNPKLKKVILLANLKTVLKIETLPGIDLKEVAKVSFPELFQEGLSKEFYYAIREYIFHLVREDGSITLGSQLLKVIGGDFKLIEKYDISRFYWTFPILDKDVRAFSAFLSRTPIVHLDFENSDIKKFGFEVLASLIPPSNITQLSLPNCEVDAAAAVVLAGFLPETKIRLLNLRGNRIGASGVKELAHALPRTQVVSLDLQENEIGDEGVLALAHALVDIQNVSLQSNGITANGVKRLVEVLPFTSISHLNLRGNPLRDFSVQLLTAVLPSTNITHLNLRSSGIRNEGAKAIAEVLPRTEIKELNLGWNEVGDAGAIALAEVLPATNLTKLRLDSNRIGASGIQALVKALPHSGIQKMDFRWNIPVFESMALEVAQCLPKVKITQLNLQDSGVGDEQIVSLANALPDTKIIQLELGWNSIGDVGAIALAAALPRTVLNRLDLKSNRIGNEGAQALGDVLDRTNITHLDLTENQLIRRSGVAALVDAMGRKAGLQVLVRDIPSQNLSLDLENYPLELPEIRELAGSLSRYPITRLDFRGNGLGDDGAVVLANAFPSTLTWLDLQNNRIGDAGMIALANVLSQSFFKPGVTSLNLASNRIGDEGAKAFANALYRTKIITIDLRNNELILKEGSLALVLAVPDARVDFTLLYNNPLDLFHNLRQIGMAALIRKLSKVRGITNLNLSLNHLTDSDLELLCGLLTSAGQEITHLNLESNALGDAAARRLADALRRGARITSRLSFAPTRRDDGRFIGKWWDSTWDTSLPPSPPQPPLPPPRPRQLRIPEPTSIELSFTPSEMQMVRGSRRRAGSDENTDMKFTALEFADLLDEVSFQAYRESLPASEREGYIDFSQRLSSEAKDLIQKIHERMSPWNIRPGFTYENLDREIKLLETSLESSDDRKEAYEARIQKANRRRQARERY